MNNTELAVKLTALNSTLATLQNLNVAPSILNNLKKEISEVEKEINEITINGGLFELLQTTILEFCKEQNINSINLNLNITMDAGACVISKLASKKVNSSGEGSGQKTITNKFKYELTTMDGITKELNLTNLLYMVYGIDAKYIETYKDSYKLADNYNALLHYMTSINGSKISHTNIFEKLDEKDVYTILGKAKNINNIQTIKAFKNDEVSNVFVFDAKLRQAVIDEFKKEETEKISE